MKASKKDRVGVFGSKMAFFHMQFSRLENIFFDFYGRGIIDWGTRPGKGGLAIG